MGILSFFTERMVRYLASAAGIFVLVGWFTIEQRQKGAEHARIEMERRTVVVVSKASKAAEKSLTPPAPTTGVRRLLPGADGRVRDPSTRND
jgi:hypothetical protein